MKRHKELFAKIGAWDNLLSAFHKAAKGKRKKAAVAAFELRLESELLALQKALLNKTYQPGGYHAFTILDPKERLISAAPFRDRIVHHALCNVIEPLFERTFIHQSYANRKGKGTHKAIVQYQEYARQYRYVLKCDIRKFFPSIDHEILKAELRRKIGCPDTCWLIDLIIDNSNPQEEHLVYFPGDDLFTPHTRRRGLPIGNLTSQFWANVYMNRFDHWVKESLRAPAYIRYVDDFVLFSNDVKELQLWKAALQARLQELRLLLHPRKSEVLEVVLGVPFLGFRVFPHHRVVKKDSVRRYRRRLRKSVQHLREGRLGAEVLECRLNSWLGHVRFGMSRRLEYNVFWYLIFQKVNLFKKPNYAWAVLERN
jgi:RNA-directed DNA polymerase